MATAPKILKVSATSSPKSVAGALAALVREGHTEIEMQAIGAGAVNQAVKALAIARGFVAPGGTDLVCIPAFADVKVQGDDGEEHERTAIRLIVEAR